MHFVTRVSSLSSEDGMEQNCSSFSQRSVPSFPAPGLLRGDEEMECGTSPGTKHGQQASNGSGGQSAPHGSQAVSLITCVRTCRDLEEVSTSEIEAPLLGSRGDWDQVASFLDFTAWSVPHMCPLSEFGPTLP